VQAGSVSNREGEPSTREEARRSPGQGLCKKALEGQNPREVPVVAGLKTCATARRSREARTQKPRLVGPVWRFGGGNTAGLTVSGFFPAERSGNLAGEETFEG